VKRYAVVAASVLIQACLGGIYAWSAFAPHLASAHGITAGQSGLIFGVALATLTVAMVFAGRLQEVHGPRLVAVAGGVAYGCGYWVASASGGSFPLLLLGAGMLAGVGLGCGYVCALATSIKWFPRHRGLVTGIVVAGFGGGAIVLSNLTEALIQGGWTVLGVFRFMGLGYGSVILVAALMLSVPGGAAAAATGARGGGRLIADPGFRAFLLGMFSGTFGGLLVIGNLKPLGLAGGLPSETATLAVGVFAIGNASGRVFWGWLHDRLGWTSIPLSLGALAVGLAALAAAKGAAAFVVVAAAVGFTFGACFALYPARVAARFGQENVGRVYPWVFLAYGFSGLTAPAVGGWIYDLSGSYAPALVGAVAVAAVGAAVTWRWLAAIEGPTGAVALTRSLAPDTGQCGDPG